MHEIWNGNDATWIAHLYSQIADETRDSELTGPCLNINPLECKGNYSVTLNNMKSVHWPLTDGAVTFGTARRGLGRAAARPGANVPNVTAHPSTASCSAVSMCPLKGEPTVCAMDITQQS